MDFIPSQNRSRAKIYQEMIEENRIVELRNQGYRFVVVDWKNSRIDMRFNALYVVNLIQRLKETLPDNEQFVVIGESMGGVIGRYALTYMESRNYTAQNTSPFFVEQFDENNVLYLATHPQIFNLPTNWVLPEKMHNTRLFISMDAPQQGANVPLSVQKAYKKVLNVFGPFVGTIFKTTTTVFNLFLESKAAKQLLIEHISTESGSGFYKTYSSTNSRNIFMEQLNAMGSYPQFAKIMLMSNGALNGSNQIQPYTLQPRVPNDRIIQLKLDIYGKVLGIKIPLMGGSIGAFTNPDGRGKILEANAGWFSIRIKLKWFGIKITTGYNSLFETIDYANSKPYCVSAGSYIGNGKTRLIGSQANTNGFNVSNNYWLLNLYSIQHYVDGQGCSGIKIHQGWNGFLSSNLNLSLCTDGMQFGFIPTYSALDYNARGILNTNFENIPIATKLANIPARADVIVGIPSTFRPSNTHHLEFRNDGIFNLTGATSAFNGNLFFNSYWSCQTNDNRVRRGFLNLEIGDEELYLENNSLQYNAQYKVEYDLHLNRRNPNYQYNSTLNPLPSTVLLGIYSKQDLFSIAPTGFATFIYDATNGPVGHTGFYGTTIGSFTQINEPLENCCVRFSTLNKGVPLTNPLTTSLLKKNDKNNFLEIFPNPNDGRNISLKYKFKCAGKVQLSLINMQGVVVLCKPIFIPNSKLEITSSLNIGNIYLANGVYIIKLSNGYETLFNKLVVSK